MRLLKLATLVDRAEAFERAGAHRPRAGLADAAGNGDDTGAGPGAGGAAEGDQGVAGVLDLDEGKLRLAGRSATAPAAPAAAASATKS